MNGRPNSDVLRPWLNAMDLVRDASDTWVIDFSEKLVEEAIQYEVPFQYARDKVLPIRTRTVRNAHGKNGGCLSVIGLPFAIS